MEEITLKIPSDKISFFKDLIKQLGFEISSDSDWYNDLTKDQKISIKKSIDQHNKGETFTNEEAMKRIDKFLDSKKS